MAARGLALALLLSLAASYRLPPRTQRTPAARTRLHMDGPMGSDYDITEEELEALSPGRPKIHWFPGHIAKAERQLVEYLGCVDVVIEVRDARIPRSTTHPLVPTWIGAKPHVIVFNRRDCAPESALRDWRGHFVEEAVARAKAHGAEAPETPIFNFNAKSDKGIHEIKKACLRLGAHVNDRRAKRDLLPRAIRVAVIGFPNVGKSALINRLLGRKMAKSADTPGITRSLQWVRLGKDREGADIELLDSPGIIPAKQVNQDAAEALAMCNDIGVASYDPEHVATALIERLVCVDRATDGAYVNAAQIARRCDGFDPFWFCGDGGGTPEEFVHEIADMRHRGDRHGAATRLLNDFRKGMFGLATLEAPPRVLQRQREQEEESEAQQAAAPKGAEAKKDVDFDLNTFGVGDFEGW